MVIKYDIQLREAFAARRHLSFADFASDELSHLKHLALAGKEEHTTNAQASTSKYKNQSTYANARNTSTRPRFDKKPRTESPWAGKIKDTSNLPRNQQICGGWNLNKCDGTKCGRIHNMCDYIGCYESHRRTSHSI